jgi:hypothetical protein
MPHGEKVAWRSAGRGQEVVVGQYMVTEQVGDRQSVHDADAHQMGNRSPFLHFRCVLLLRGGEVAVPGVRLVGRRPIAVEAGLFVLDQPLIAGTNDPEEYECIDRQPGSAARVGDSFLTRLVWPVGS